MPASTGLTEKEARKRVKKIKAWRGHAAAFVLVNAFLVALNLFTSPGHFWAVYPLLGWGLGFAIDTWETFGGWGLSRDWEERKVRELMGEEASAERLRALVRAELDEEQQALERAVPAGPMQDPAQLQRRIEHLEAIVTSRDWDALDQPHLASLDLDEPDAETEAERAARLARRVR